MIRPDMIKAITIEHYKKYEKFVPLFRFEKVNKGILFTEGEKWQCQRKLISVSFNFEAMKNNLTIMK